MVCLQEVSVGILEVKRFNVPGNARFAHDGFQQVDSVSNFDPRDRRGVVPVLGMLAVAVDTTG